MATDQDFSFPTINEPFSHSIDSPPLWNLSPAASPNPYEDFITQKRNEDGKRKSLSCIENCGRRREEEDDDDEWKEKMDLLWEDFNEELCSTTTDTTSSSRTEDRIELRTVAKRRSYNNNGAALLLPSRKGNIKVLVKVLKKLFSVSNSQKKPRNRVIMP